MQELLNKLQEMDAELFAERNEAKDYTSEALIADAKLEFLNEFIDWVEKNKTQLQL